MKKVVFSMALLTALSYGAKAQRMMGIATSNWSGTTSLALNPANLGDNRAKFALDLFGLNFGIDNNLGQVDVSKATSGAGGDGGLGAGLLTFSGNDKFSIVMPAADLRLPGAMYTIDNKNAVAISLRFRAFNQFNNFDKTLFQSVMDPTASAATGYNLSSADFNWTMHMWSEINLSYSRVVYEEGEHFVKAGITLGKMNGVGFVGIAGHNLNANFYTNDSLVATNTDIEFASNIVDSAGELAGGLGGVSLFGNSGSGGSGIRADIGAVYEYRPDKYDPKDGKSNKYKVRGSFAITDIGKIKYKSAMSLTAKGNGMMSASDLAANALNYSSLKDYMNNRGFFLDTGMKAYKVGIPTAMVLGVDYYVASHFYVNATWIKNMANRSNIGNSYYGQLTVTPRWDTKIFSFALPVTYSALSKGIKTGVGVRLGGLYFGSDDMMLFLTGKGYGVNFYMGAYVPINRKFKGSKSSSATDGAGRSESTEEKK
jgi:hypothetical protein